MFEIPTDTPWWARLLVDGWQTSYKWFSVQLLTVLAVLPEAYNAIPDLQTMIPPQYMTHIQSAIALLAIIGRVAAQKKVTP